MSASRRPTTTHLRQHRLKKRKKLLARIAAKPSAGPSLEAKVLRTYSRFHSTTREKKLPPAEV